METKLIGNEELLAQAKKVFKDADNYSEKYNAGCYRVVDRFIQSNSEFDEKSMSIESVKVVLSQLQWRYYEIIYLYCFENRTLEEIAKIVGLSRVRVNIRVKEMIPKLKALLEEYEEKKNKEGSETKQENYSTFIDVLYLSKVPHNALWRKGIRTTGKLIEYSREDLQQIYNINRKYVSEIENKLKELYPNYVMKTTPRDVCDCQQEYYIPIERLLLSAKTYHVLWKAQIKTVEELLNFSYEELLSIPNMGKFCVVEITDKIKHFYPAYEPKRNSRLSFQEIQTKQEIDTIPIIMLNLSTSTSIALRKIGMKTVAQLLEFSYEDLLQIPDIKKSSITEIEDSLKAFCLEYELKKELSLNVPGTCNMSIKSLEFSTRTTNALLRGGVETIEQLLKFSREDLISIHNVGKCGVTEIEEKLKSIFPDYAMETQKSIDSLNLSTRASNVLKRAGVETIEQLLELSHERLLRIRNMGEGCLAEIKDKLKSIYPDYAVESENSIDALNLSTRASFALRRRGVKTIEQLLEISREEFLTMNNLGKVTITEIENKLKEIYPGYVMKDKSFQCIKETIHSQEIEELSINQLSFSARTYNALARGGIKTVKQLLEFSYEDLLRIRNLGKGCIVEIEEKLKEIYPDYEMKKKK